MLVTLLLATISSALADGCEDILAWGIMESTETSFERSETKTALEVLRQTNVAAMSEQDVRKIAAQLGGSYGLYSVDASASVDTLRAKLQSAKDTLDSEKSMSALSIDVATLKSVWASRTVTDAWVQCLWLQKGGFVPKIDTDQTPGTLSMSLRFERATTGAVGVVRGISLVGQDKALWTCGGNLWDKVKTLGEYTMEIADSRQVICEGPPDSVVTLFVETSDGPFKVSSAHKVQDVPRPPIIDNSRSLIVYPSQRVFRTSMGVTGTSPFDSSSSTRLFVWLDQGEEATIEITDMKTHPVLWMRGAGHDATSASGVLGPVAFSHTI